MFEQNFFGTFDKRTISPLLTPENFNNWLKELEVFLHIITL